MAVALTLTDGTTTYNLLTGALKLRYQGWEMQGPSPEGETTLQGYGASYKFTGYHPITETFTLYAAAAATELSIRQAVRDIDKILEQARRWHTNPGTEGTATFTPLLTFSTGTEAAARQALLYGGNLTMLAGNGAQPTLSNNNALALLTLTRHPLWSDASITNLYGPTARTTCGGYSTVLTQTGTAPASVLISIGAPAALTTAVTKIWVGFLSTGNITRTWFNPVLDFNSGTAGTDGTKKADPAGNDMGGNTIEVTFATQTTLYKRASISLSQIDATATHWESWHGVYRVLCRCRVSAGSIGLQLKWGVSGTADANLLQATETVIAHTAYKFIDLGEVQIPLEGRMGYAADSQLQVWGERISGAGNLYLDALILMPAEHIAILDNANVWYDTDTSCVAYIASDADDRTYCYQTNRNLDVSSIPDLSARDFFFPCYPSGIAVVVAERTAGSIATDNVNLGVATYARWMHYKDT